MSSATGKKKKSVLSMTETFKKCIESYRIINTNNNATTNVNNKNIQVVMPVSSLVGEKSVTTLSHTVMGTSFQLSGKFAVPPEDYPAFLEKYAAAVYERDEINKSTTPLFSVLEAHARDYAPLVIDFDLKAPMSQFDDTTSLLYRKAKLYDTTDYSFMQNLCQRIAAAVKETVDFFSQSQEIWSAASSTSINTMRKGIKESIIPLGKNELPSELFFYISEKPNYTVSNGEVKDGFHIHVPQVVLPYRMLFYIRDILLETTADLFDSMKLTNSIDDIIDERVFMNNSIFLYGSGKEPIGILNSTSYQSKYSLSYVIIASGTTSSMINQNDTIFAYYQSPKTLLRLVQLMNLQYIDDNEDISIIEGPLGAVRKVPLFRDLSNDVYLRTRNRDSNERRIKKNNDAAATAAASNPDGDDEDHDISADDCHNGGDLSEERVEELRFLLSILPDFPYTYNYWPWFQIRNILKNEDRGTNKLRTLWHEFSERCPEKYNYEDCERRWYEQAVYNYQVGTLIHFIQQHPESHAKLKEYRYKSVNALYSQIILRFKTINHFDFAQILYEMKKYQVVFAGSTKKDYDWYYFDQKKRWVYDPNCSILKNLISREILRSFSNIYDIILECRKAKNNDDNGSLYSGGSRNAAPTKKRAGGFVPRAIGRQISASSPGGNNIIELSEYNNIEDADDCGSSTRRRRMRKDDDLVAEAELEMADTIQEMVMQLGSKTLNSLMLKCEAVLRNLKSETYKTSIINECISLFQDIKFFEKSNENPNLFGFNNGVLNLETICLERPDPSHLVTMTAGYNYISETELTQDEMEIMGEIKQFFIDIFPNEHVRDFVLMDLATCLKGGNFFQRFTVWIGGGANGKGVLENLIMVTFGDYYGTIKSQFYVEQEVDSTKPNSSLANLKAKRICVSSEISKGAQVNGQRLKLVTGENMITVRKLHQDDMTYMPQFKPYLTSNYPLTFDDPNSHAYRRRMVSVRFVTTFYSKGTKDAPKELGPNQKWMDHTLQSKIKRWAPYFMVMLVNYYKEFVRRGSVLELPEEVADDSSKFLKENDPYTLFVRENLISTAGSPITLDDIEGDIGSNKNNNTTLSLQDVFDKYLQYFRNSFRGKGRVPGTIGPFTDALEKILQPGSIDSNKGVIYNYKFRYVATVYQAVSSSKKKSIAYSIVDDDDDDDDDDAAAEGEPQVRKHKRGKKNKKSATAAQINIPLTNEETELIFE